MRVAKKPATVDELARLFVGLVDGEDPLGPVRTLVGRVSTFFKCEIAGSFDRMVADRLHHLIDTVKVLIAPPHDPGLSQHLSLAHDAHADRTCFLVGFFHFGQRIEVEIHHVVQHPDRCGNHPRDVFRCVDLGEVDRGEVAHRRIAIDLFFVHHPDLFAVQAVQRGNFLGGLGHPVVHRDHLFLFKRDHAPVFEGQAGFVVVGVGVLINLGAEIGTADDTGMAVGVGFVRGILETEEGVTCLKIAA